jgi:hypothetical protein
VTLDLGQAASLAVGVQTRLQDGTLQTDPSEGVVAANTAMPLGVRVFPPATGSLATSFNLTSLYPFASPDGYSVFSGSCQSADPSQYVSDYFGSNPGFVSLPPGGAGAAVTVREPAMNIQVEKNGKPLPSARVSIHPLSGDCADNPPYVYSGSGTGNTSLTTAGTLLKPGLPFGHYEVCAYDQAANRTKRSVTLLDVANTDPAGTATQTLDITSASPLAACRP